MSLRTVMSRRVGALSCAAVLGLGLAACGSDDKPADAGKEASASAAADSFEDDPAAPSDVSALLLGQDKAPKDYVTNNVYDELQAQNQQQSKDVLAEMEKVITVTTDPEKCAELFPQATQMLRHLSDNPQKSAAVEYFNPASQASVSVILDADASPYALLDDCMTFTRTLSGELGAEKSRVETTFKATSEDIEVPGADSATKLTITETSTPLDPESGQPASEPRSQESVVYLAYAKDTMVRVLAPAGEQEVATTLLKEQVAKLNG